MTISVTRLTQETAVNGVSYPAGDYVVLEDDYTLAVYTPTDMQATHPEYVVRASYLNVVLQDTVALKSNWVSDPTSADVFQSVTDLQFPVQPGYIYSFRFVLPFGISPDINTGMWFAIDGPTATKVDYVVYWTGVQPVQVGSAPYDFLTTVNQPGLIVSLAQGSYDGLNNSGNGVMRGPDGDFAFIDGYVIPSAAGQIVARASCNNDNYTITIQRGANVDYKGIPI